jgi:hypothetical protein
MIVQLQQLPRLTTSIALWSARLPLATFEAIVRRGQSNEYWPPAVAYDRFEAAVKETVGKALRDETLVGLGTLQRAEVHQREDARERAAEAARTREEAHDRAQSDHDELDQRRRDANVLATNRRRTAQTTSSRTKQRVAEEAAAKAAGARTSAAARTAQVDKRAIAGESDRLRQEAAVLRTKKQTVAAKRRVSDLDKATRSKKAARQAR